VVSGTITIRFDSANPGFVSDNIGMDSVAFGQGDAAPVPLPTALPMFATVLAYLGILAAPRRRPHRA